MKRFLRVLSITLLISNSVSFVKAGGDKGQASSSAPVFLGHLAEAVSPDVGLVAPQTENVGCGTEDTIQEVPNVNVVVVPKIVINMPRSTEEDQNPDAEVNDGQYGPAKEKTVTRPKPLSPEFLETCYESSSEEIKDVILELQHRTLATKTNTPTALLLYGPHGTGKTTLAQVLAQKSDPVMDCWVIHAGGLLNSYQDGSEEALKKSLAPLDEIDSSKQCVVLIDEIDVLTDGHNNTKGSDRASAVVMSKIIDSVYDKQNLLLVLATNNRDEIPETVTDRLQLNYFKIDVPGKAELKSAIDHWFNVLEKTEFKCETRSLRVRFLNMFRKSMSQKENNEEFKQYLVNKTAGWFMFNGSSYRDLRDLFTTARKIAFKRAVKKKETIVTTTTQDFESAFIYVEAKKKEIRRGLWGSTKKFCKDNPVLAGAIGTVIVAGAGIAIHHYWEHLPQMRQAEAHHKEIIKHTKFGEKLQLTGLAAAGASIALAIDIACTGGTCTATTVVVTKTVVLTKIAVSAAGAAVATGMPYALHYGKDAAKWVGGAVKSLWS